MFDAPVIFEEAVQFAAKKQLLPTLLGSQELRQLGSDVRRASLFSARTTEARYLADVQGMLDSLLKGETNEASARAELQATLQRLSYRPESGFPGDAQFGIEPAEAGKLRDLSSDARVKLVLETNQRMAQNYGRLLQGNEPDALWQYPAWELVRIYPREVERGFRRGKGGALEADPDNAWEERWQKAGGDLVDGRMIALKGAEIWTALGDSGTFEDGLDNPFPPFAFNSGMGWREVPRDEAVELGLVDADQSIGATVPRFAGSLDDETASVPTDLLREALASLQ